MMKNQYVALKFPARLWLNNWVHHYHALPQLRTLELQTQVHMLLKPFVVTCIHRCIVCYIVVNKSTYNDIIFMLMLWKAVLK